MFSPLNAVLGNVANGNEIWNRRDDVIPTDYDAVTCYGHDYRYYAIDVAIVMNCNDALVIEMIHSDQHSTE